MKRHRWAALILGLVIILLAVPLLMSACSSGTTPTPTPTAAKITYKFGASIALSGAGAPLGTAEQKGIQTAIDYINNVWGGINGHQVQAIIYDDQSSPDVAITNVNKLIFQDNVIGVVGASNGGSTLAIAPILNSNHIVEVTCTGVVDPNVESTYAYEFQAAPTQYLNAEATLAYISKAWGAKTIGVLHASDAYGATAIPTLTAALSKYGVQIVADESYDFTDTDMTAQWIKIRSANPDAAVLWGSGAPPAIAIKNARTLQLSFPIMGTLGMASQGFLDSAGSAANDIVIPAFIVGDDPLPRQVDFVNAYHAKFNAYPTFYDSMGWDGIMLMANALKRMGGPDVVNTDQFRQAFQAEMQATKDLPLASAVYTMSPTDHTGIKISDYVYIQAENDKFVRLDFTP
jgi:branched-chain amino acid transport system substrate-binding protein